MEAQRVVVIQDASREVNSKVCDWALNGLSLKAGDKLTLAAVLHQVTTSMGYKMSVDTRIMVGTNQRVVEVEVAKKKEEYLNNKELVQIFKLYKSKKESYAIYIGDRVNNIQIQSRRRRQMLVLRQVEFDIEVATGSSPKAVALKIAMKLNATWVILDRKMKNDKEYFFQKLSCNISRLRLYNRIVHLRGRPILHQQRQDNTHESIPVSMLDSVPHSAPDSVPHSAPDSVPENVNEQDLEQGQESNHHDEAGCSEPASGSNQTEETNPVQLNSTNTIRHHGDKIDQKLKSKLEESESYKAHEGSNKEAEEQRSESTEAYQKSEEFICSGGAKNYYLGSAEEYAVCEKFFSLCNSLG